MGQSTTAKGNAFRDLLEQVLAAAGFSTRAEQRVGFKHADVAAVWTRDEIAGEQRYAFEAKDYAGTLPVAECAAFAAESLPLLSRGDIDQAWLVSRGPLSPAGRQVAEGHHGLKIMTFAELQRRIMLMDGFLRDLVAQHEASSLERFYIRPETPDGEDLEAQVERWIAEEGAPPMFVLGSYGKGKSTFAGHLAASMARKALADPTSRLPILVRLGEIADEQSIEGLLGKVLASQHRVSNYHFETLRALNRVGRFLLVYDGFDEMKHGLTPAKFQQVMTELMRLDDGEARILVLGRDTAFHDEAEFRAVVDGVQRTAAGREVPIPRRRRYRHVHIRGWTPDEARAYVALYLPIRAAEERDGPARDPNWVQRRVAELSTGRFDRLLERPVHAQMLCEIAVQPDQLRPDMSVYELFDSFTHYLLHREIAKRGRDPDFPIDARRRFNAALAWWLWERGGASTTTLADIPQSICDAATRDLRHSLGREEARRELIQGCLVEKGVSTIYFHRSLQEFLAAEHLIETDLLQRAGSNDWLSEVTKAVTPEVVEFVVAGANTSTSRRDRALGWLDALGGAHGASVSLAGFELFTSLARELDVAIQDPRQSPWLTWLAFLQRTGARDFSHRQRNTFPVLADLVVGARRGTREAQAAALYALARTLYHPTPPGGPSPVQALAAMLPAKRLRDAVEQASVKKSERHIVLQSEEFALWAMLRSWSVERRDDGLVVRVDVTRLHHDCMTVLQVGFDSDFDMDDAVEIVEVPVQAIYRSLVDAKQASEREIDGIRPFFNDPDLRRSIAPLEVETRRPAARPKPQAPRPARDRLSPRHRA